MITISSLTASTLSLGKITLNWLVGTTAEPINTYQLDVYRAETPEPTSEFTLISSGLAPDAYTYSDTTHSGLTTLQWHNWFYRFKIIQIANPSNYAWTDPVTVETLPDPKAKIILNQRTKALKKYGVSLKVLKKVVVGDECTYCWDPVLSRITEDECPVCHGGGKIGGYYNQIGVKGTMTLQPKFNQITPFGTWQPGDALAKVLNYPILNPDDVIVDNLNRRWKVRQVAPTEVMNTLVGQQIQLSLQEKSSPVHGVTLT